MHRLVPFTILIAVAAASAQPSRTPADPEAAKIYQHYPVVELVTMGIGDRMWERHGHIALCVRYADRRLDTCYNYGTANFGEPLSMAWGFFRGTNSFWASASSPRSMLSIYHQADRTIWVQPLPLTPEQERQVIAQLEHDILEENRYYSYDHFWDNCTTRARDIIDDATGGVLKDLPGPPSEATIRDLAREGFAEMRIPSLITDIAMGRVTDQVPSYHEKMFLPQYLREAVVLKWGIKPIVVYQRKGPPHPTEGPSGRWLFALLILIWTIPAWATRKWGRFQRTGMALAIAPMFVLGVVLWMLAIVSPLSYVRFNETLLLFFPLDLALVFLRGSKARLYARGRVASLALFALLSAVGVLTQPLWAPLLWPLIPAATVAFWPKKD